MSFPLYQQLSEKSKQIQKRMSPDQLGVVASQLNPNNRNILYFLLLHYAQQHGLQGPTPYGGNIFNGRRGLTIEISRLPDGYLEIAEAFINMVREL